MGLIPDIVVTADIQTMKNKATSKWKDNKKLIKNTNTEV